MLKVYTQPLQLWFMYSIGKIISIIRSVIIDIPFWISNFILTLVPSQHYSQMNICLDVFCSRNLLSWLLIHYFNKLISSLLTWNTYIHTAKMVQLLLPAGALTGAAWGRITYVPKTSLTQWSNSKWQSLLCDELNSKIPLLQKTS